MENNNHRQDIELTELKNNFGWLKEKVCKIEEQVFNHIPTEINKCVKRTDFIVGIGGVIVLQILLKFFL